MKRCTIICNHFLNHDFAEETLSTVHQVVQNASSEITKERWLVIVSSTSIRSIVDADSITCEDRFEPERTGMNDGYRA